jgi:hypothetical protein
MAEQREKTMTIERITIAFRSLLVAAFCVAIVLFWYSGERTNLGEVAKLKKIEKQIQ